MADEKKDNRPWWRKKTNWGILASITGATIALTPGAPVIAAVGAVKITTAMVGAFLTGVGSAWGSYGAAKRADNKTE